MTPKKVNCTGQVTSSSDGVGKHSIGSGVIVATIATLVLVGLVVGGLIGLYFIKKTQKPQILYNIVQKLVEKGKGTASEKGIYSRLETEDNDSLEESSSAAFFDTEGKE